MRLVGRGDEERDRVPGWRVVRVQRQHPEILLPRVVLVVDQELAVRRKVVGVFPPPVRDPESRRIGAAQPTTKQVGAAVGAGPADRIGGCGT
jgi:hypothetical protein